MKPLTTPTRWWVGVLFPLLCACAGTPTTLVDPGWQWPDQACVTLLHADVQVWGLFDGQLLPDPERSQMATEALIQALSTGRLPLRKATIDPRDQEQVNEHLALYDRVAAQALLNQNSMLWTDRQDATGVSIGRGLSHLAGDLGHCPLLLVLQGYQVPQDRAFVHSPQLSLGVVERVSGRLLWLRVLRLSATDRLTMAVDVARLADDMILGLLP